MPKDIQIDLTNLPHHTNDAFYPLYWNQSRYLVLRGGAGSSKSDFAASKCLFRTLTEEKSRILVVRKVARNIRNSVWQLFIDIIARWGVGSVFKQLKNEFRLTCANGNEILFVGLDDVEKLKSIQGITSIFIEEATDLLSVDEFDQIDLRLRGIIPGNPYKQIILAFNPVSETHWIKGRFFDRADSDATCHHSTYKDNRFLDAQYMSRIERLRELNPSYYQIYGLGYWGSLRGLVYPKVDIIDEYPSLEWLEQILYGLDFGFNHPTALIRVGVKDNTLYLFESLYETKLTNQDLIRKLPELIVTKRTQAPAHVDIYADSAEPDRIEDIRRSGYNCMAAYKGPNSIMDGINHVKEFRIVTVVANTNLNKEFGGYVWALDKEGKPKDEPIDMLNHGMDAFRYPVFTALSSGRSGKSIFLGGANVYPNERDRRYR